ncbi:MAG: DUF4003 family protein [Evtepia gabavorous]
MPGWLPARTAPWDAGRLYACRDLIQEETGLFSNFWGAGHLAVITLLALSPARRSGWRLHFRATRFCGRGFTPPKYLPLAALLLADWARGRDLDGVAAGRRRFTGG